MIQDDKNYYNEKNFVRDDWGGQVMTPNKGKTEMVGDEMVNGSSDKPYPTQANWVRNDDPDGTTIKSRFVEPTVDNYAAQPFGQVKYVKREGAPSQYEDATRNTADDNAATKRARGSTVYQVEGEDDEENQSNAGL